MAAPGLEQLVEHHRKNLGEVRDVADRIVDLALVERTAAPVGKACALVELQPDPCFDEVRISDLFGLAERHLADLGVEDRVRRLAGQVEDDFDILSARVRSEEHTSELQSLMRISYAVFCFQHTHNDPSYH